MIELLSSFSITQVQTIAALPTDYEIMNSLSMGQIQLPGELPQSDEVISFMSIPSSPYPLQGGGTNTELRDMKTKIIRIGR